MIYENMKIYVTKDNLADIYHMLQEKAPYDQLIKNKEKLKNLDKSIGGAIARLEDLREEQT
jgi:peptide subunit release factor 1 (eRF1)